MVLSSLIGLVVTSCAGASSRSPPPPVPLLTSPARCRRPPVAGFYPDHGLLWRPYKLMQVIQEEEGSAGARAAVFFLALTFVTSQVRSYSESSVLFYFADASPASSLGSALRQRASHLLMLSLLLDVVLTRLSPLDQVAGNAISGSIDLSTLLPRYVNGRRGPFIVAIVGFAVCPWEFLNTANAFISVLSGFSIFLGPLAGIMMADYFLIRRQKIKLSDLYTANKSSIYWYTHGEPLVGNSSILEVPLLTCSPFRLQSPRLRGLGARRLPLPARLAQLGQQRQH
jgi:hypothetical protein